ncbi:protein O-mannosyl-transferase family [Pedobacter sp. P26]|uniref:protein O-mannosyl-transferase family n=1 Tax=Pedobacter sp. P26 TaxID=3423956 RepID=UPI003D67E4BA
MNYSRINTIGGWLCFSVAALTYILTLDQSVSFWDCGEFISSAFRMEVVHQPGAPIVSMIQRLFSALAFGDKTKVAYFVNIASAPCKRRNDFVFILDHYRFGKENSD